MDSLSIQTAANLIDDILIETPPQNGVIKLGSSVIKIPTDKDGKKNETELDKLEIGIANNVKNILVDKIFYSHIKKHKFKDDMKSIVKTGANSNNSSKAYYFKAMHKYITHIPSFQL